MTDRPKRRVAGFTIERWLDERSARVEMDGELVQVPRVLLPADASPDDVLVVERTGDRVTISIDREATDDARRRARRTAARLRRRDAGGSLTL
jgi:hypothetical protein